MNQYMQNNQIDNKIGTSITDSAKFSLLSAVVNLGSAFATYPLNKMNIRTKSGVLAPSNSSIITQFKNFYRLEGLRGIYQGASLLPAAAIPVNFVQNYIYESLNHYWKKSSYFKENPTLMSLLPLISVVALTPLACVSAIFSVVYTLIHSQRLSNLQAIKSALKKDKKVFIESFKVTGINTILIMGTRQFVYEHVTKKFKQYKLPKYLNLILTSTIVGLTVGLIYQPFQVILTLLALGDRKNSDNNISKIIKREGLKSITTKGLKFRLLISMIISITGVPLYSLLKQQFNLNLYI